MSKKLIITEKPSVAMEFAKVLKITANRKNGYIESDEWIITWCVGHLVTMSYPEVYDEKLKFWRLDTLPFIPEEWKYEVIPAVQKQFGIVQSLLQREDVEEIYNAGDSGREGEYIQRLVFMMAKPNPKAKIKRVWIDSQTEEEILRGINEAKDLSEYDSLSDSAYLRAKEDYLIGINFSRILTLAYGKQVAKLNNEEKVSISVGRVMTCVLGMIVDRENEIRNFVKSKFYKIQPKFKEGLTAEWKYGEDTKMPIVKLAVETNNLYNDNGFKNEADAISFVEALKKSNAKPVVLEASKKNQKENAPLLYNLAEIQNECSKKFKISPDKTLEIIQELYEKKLVTYPRTDARVISTAVAKEINKNLNGLARFSKDEEVSSIVKKMIENKYSTDIVKSKYVNDSKITDHYALIPTGQGFENYDKLGDLQKDVYRLIAKRFLSIFFPAAEYTKLSVTVDINGEKFYANAKVCTKLGYLEALKGEQTDEDGEQVQDTSSSADILKSIKKGQELTLEDIGIKEGETAPPTRYSSGSIILAMENAGKLIEDEKLREQIKGTGIGTSATRAEIIKKLNRIGYIDINSKTQILTPSSKGELIYKVVRWAVPDMLNPQLTASWEKGLEMVANREIVSEIFMEKLEKYVRSKIDRVKRG